MRNSCVIDKLSTQDPFLEEIIEMDKNSGFVGGTHHRAIFYHHGDHYYLILKENGRDNDARWGYFTLLGGETAKKRMINDYEKRRFPAIDPCKNRSREEFIDYIFKYHIDKPEIFFDNLDNHRGAFLNCKRYFILFEVTKTDGLFKILRINSVIWGTPESITLKAKKYEEMGYKVYNKDEVIYKICKCCGRRLLNTPKNKEFCDEWCRYQHNKHLAKLKKFDEKVDNGEIEFSFRSYYEEVCSDNMRICKNCEIKFTPIKSESKFCSKKCRDEFNNKKKKMV